MIIQSNNDNVSDNKITCHFQCRTFQSAYGWGLSTNTASVTLRINKSPIRVLFKASWYFIYVVVKRLLKITSTKKSLLLAMFEFEILRIQQFSNFSILWKNHVAFLTVFRMRGAKKIHLPPPPLPDHSSFLPVTFSVANVEISSKALWLLVSTLLPHLCVKFHDHT